MASVIAAIIASVVAVGLAGASIGTVVSARTRWSHGGAGPPLLVRWAWAALVACGALTALLLLFMGWYHIGSRGMQGAIEGSLSCRMAGYTAIVGWLLARLPRRLRIRWPRWRRRGPRLLPPAGDTHNP